MGNGLPMAGAVSGLGAGADCWFPPYLIIRFRRTSITCSAGRDAARVDARVLPTVAVSVAEMEDRVCPSVAVCAAVAPWAPANIAVEDVNPGLID